MTKHHPCDENIHFSQNLTKFELTKIARFKLQKVAFSYLAVNQCELSPHLRRVFNI